IFTSNFSLPPSHHRNFAVRWSLHRGPPPLGSPRPNDSNKTSHLIDFNYSHRRRHIRNYNSRPLPLDSSHQGEANETPLSNFHQRLAEITTFTLSFVAPPYLRRPPIVSWWRPTSLLRIAWRTRMSTPMSALCIHRRCPRQPSTWMSFLYYAVNPIESAGSAATHQPNLQDFPLAKVAQPPAVIQNQAKKSFVEAVNSQSTSASFSKAIQHSCLVGAPPTKLGEKNGIPGFAKIQFSTAETERLSEQYKFAIVGKFSDGFPSYRNMHRLLSTLKLQGPFTVTMITNRHVLINLKNEVDYTRLWIQILWHIDGFPMRTFKWTPSFRPQQQSSLAPQQKGKATGQKEKSVKQAENVIFEIGEPSKRNEYGAPPGDIESKNTFHVLNQAEDEGEDARATENASVDKNVCTSNTGDLHIKVTRETRYHSELPNSHFTQANTNVPPAPQPCADINESLNPLPRCLTIAKVLHHNVTIERSYDISSFNL
ncbi:UNVERIFIED_CONTAM: hypothetical protein Sindi_2947400, partial [Sesamum indicum]